MVCGRLCCTAGHSFSASGGALSRQVEHSWGGGCVWMCTLCWGRFSESSLAGGCVCGEGQLGIHSVLIGQCYDWGALARGRASLCLCGVPVWPDWYCLL